jgi:predicted ester cyclase
MANWLVADDSHGGVLSLRDALVWAFPDQVIIVDRLLAERQPDGSVMVAAESSFSGTHRGRLCDFPATGRKVTVPGYQSFRVEDGRITDFCPLWDWRGLFDQLGPAVPVPTGAPTGLPPGKDQHLDSERGAHLTTRSTAGVDEERGSCGADRKRCKSRVVTAISFCRHLLGGGGG